MIPPITPTTVERRMEQAARDAFANRFDGPPRHIVIRDNRWLDAFCIAGAVFAVVYFCGQLLRGVL